MPFLRGELGVPLLADALAYCEYWVVEDVTAGTHRVFPAEVIDAVARDGTPLTYFRGQFGRFETTEDRPPSMPNCAAGSSTGSSRRAVRSTSRSWPSSSRPALRQSITP